MQFCDMKALRIFSANKRLFLLNPKKPPKYPLSIISRQFHPTGRSLAARESSLALESSKGEPHPSPSSSGRNSGNAPRVWSVFDPISGEIVTARVVEGSGERESEPGTSSSSYSKAVEEFDGERTCGSVKEGNLSEGEGTHPGLSGYVDGIGVVSVENRVSDGRDEDSVDGKSYANVKKKGLGSVDRAPHYSGKQQLFNEKKFGGLRRGGDSVNGAGTKNISGSRKTGKSKISYVCESCGYTDGQWWGYCRACNVAGSMKQFSEAKTVSGNKVIGVEVLENVISSWLPQKARDVHPIRLSDVNRGINQREWRIPLSGPFGSEVGRVLGGGLVPGSLVLIGGDPGVGKSTLLLQIAAIVADVPGLDGPAPVVYVSGEESVEQIGNRADRMEIGSENLFLYSNTDIEDILEKTQPLSPRALIVDSIQTVYLKGVIGSPGGVIQIKECTSALLRFAKRTNIPVLLTGHVTKAGDIAGPRLLEHIVDTVLYMEGEKSSSYRLLRAVKNRFGSTDELGVFEMSQSGLRAVSNPSEIFLSEQLSDSEVLAGLAVTVIMDGSRSFLIEIQALCVPESSVSRHVNGIQSSRAHMIISVLIKQAGLMLQQNAIFLNVVSGVTLTETAGDLAIAAAICSSYLEFPIPNNVAFIGEIGLGGELHSVPRMEKRLNTVAKLGYKECIVPRTTERYLSNLVGCEGMKIIGCRNLKEVISSIFKTHK